MFPIVKQKYSIKCVCDDFLVLLGKRIRVIKIPGNGCFGKIRIFCNVREGYILFSCHNRCLMHFFYRNNESKPYKPPTIAGKDLRHIVRVRPVVVELL